MKTILWLCPLTAVLTAIAPEQAAAAITLPWSTIDAGGGRSTGTSPEGAVFTVNGTVGQADAAPAAMTGGVFRATGGYWGPARIQGERPLAISRIGPQTFAVSWPYPSTGWRLQHSPTMDAGSWVDTDTSSRVISNNRWVWNFTALTGTSKLFFRLADSP